MQKYNVKRMYMMEHPSRIVRRGLTLEEAQRHCRDPESSSRTAKGREAQEHTQLYGPWFDGYGEE